MNTKYLNLLLKAHMCEDRTGICFSFQLKLIMWVIEETIQDDHVRFDKQIELLEAITLQRGRLTLDCYNAPDKYAYDMNEQEKAYTVKWREITNKEVEKQEYQKGQHCFHMAWQHFGWFDPACSCYYQCLEFIRESDPCNLAGISA